jgi:hypothetical protein
MDPIDKLSEAYHRGLTDGERRGSDRTRQEGRDAGYKEGYERGYNDGLSVVFGHPAFWGASLALAGVFIVLGMILRGVFFPCPC